MPPFASDVPKATRRSIGRTPFRPKLCISIMEVKFNQWSSKLTSESFRIGSDWSNFKPMIALHLSSSRLLLSPPLSNCSVSLAIADDKHLEASV